MHVRLLLSPPFFFFLLTSYLKNNAADATKHFQILLIIVKIALVVLNLVIPDVVVLHLHDCVSVNPSPAAAVVSPPPGLNTPLSNRG